MEKKLLFFSIAIGIIFRFIQLGVVPISLNLDEVAIGYNAYSILKTGKDEYGTSFPVAFRSHDDYKAPLYIYATVLPVYFFGLTPLAVRFISALAGSITLIFTYLLFKELIKNKDVYHYLPALTTFLLAISPWHIQFSRAAFETNVAVLFIVVGVYFFIKAYEKPYNYLISTLSFALSLYTYHSTKIFLPIFGLVLLWTNRKKLLIHKYYLLASFFFGLILTLPLINFSLTPEASLRFKGTSVFNTPTLVDLNNEFRVEQIEAGRPIAAKLFHNKYLSGLNVLFRNYATHFSYDFLFFGGKGMPVHHAPNVSLMYLWEIPFLLMGFYALFAHKIKNKLLILGWLLSAPIAAALTHDVPSSTRTEIMLPIWQLITAIGILFYLNRFKGIFIFKRVFVLLIFILFFTSFYIHNYFFVAKNIYASGWQYGYKEAIEYVESIRAKDEKVIISTNLKQPHNFVAFYTRYDPKTYIYMDGGTVSGGFKEDRNAFSVYEFKHISWEEIEPKTYYIETIEAFPTHFAPIHTINEPNGNPVLKIYKTKHQ